MTRRLHLFDDARARRWEPFALTRPAAELALGALRLWERATRAWDAEYGGHLAADHLVGFGEEDGPRALAADEVDRRAHRILMSSRAVARTAPRELPPIPAELRIDGERVGWSLPPGTPLPPPGSLADPAAAPRARTHLQLDGFVLEHVWDLVARTRAQLREDLEGEARLSSATVRSPPRPPGVHVLGDGLLSLGRGAVVEPGVWVDTGAGPVVLGEAVRVLGPARLEGPLFVARGSVVLGGRVSASFVGPMCRIRGDVEGSVLLGYDNKAHDGFLGHAYLGRWVNLGALTTNSDLRNDYREVRLHTGEGRVASGLVKLGCFLGDHVKTGIGTLLGTGAIVGAGCNLFGGRAPATHLPPFRWGAAAEAPIYRLDRFLDAAARTMKRREVELAPEMRAVLERAWRGVAGTG